MLQRDGGRRPQQRPSSFLYVYAVVYFRLACGMRHPPPHLSWTSSPIEPGRDKHVRPHHLPPQNLNKAASDTGRPMAQALSHCSSAWRREPAAPACNSSHNHCSRSSSSSAQALAGGQQQQRPRRRQQGLRLVATAAPDVEAAPPAGFIPPAKPTLFSVPVSNCAARVRVGGPGARGAEGAPLVCPLLSRPSGASSAHTPLPPSSIILLPPSLLAAAEPLCHLQEGPGGRGGAGGAACAGRQGRQEPRLPRAQPAGGERVGGWVRRGARGCRGEAG